MNSTVQDLLDVSRGAGTAGHETRAVAWLLLVRLAFEGSAEARAALDALRCARRRGNATLRDVKIKEQKG